MTDLVLTARPAAEALDATFLGERIPVGPEGFVAATDYMGTDASIVRAARLSYGKGTRATSEDRQLLRYLLRHRHTSPFEHAVIQLHVRLPIYVARQWMRHRTGAFNEVSLRYSEAIDAVETTVEFRTQSTTNKQGSGGILTGHEALMAGIAEDLAFDRAKTSYRDMLNAGVAREQARKVLPVAQYTEFVWKIDLHNLLHFLKLRLDPHAQQEVREFAEAVATIVAAWVPLTWEAFSDYVLLAVTFSLPERHLLGYLLAGKEVAAIAQAESYGWLARNADGTLKNVRERVEFESKLALFDREAPWATT